MESDRFSSTGNQIIPSDRSDGLEQARRSDQLIRERALIRPAKHGGNLPAGEMCRTWVRILPTEGRKSLLITGYRTLAGLGHRGGIIPAGHTSSR